MSPNHVLKWAFLLATTWLPTSPALAGEGRVVLASLKSKQFDQNKIGISPVRNVQVYLPYRYESSRDHYPVIYFLHGLFENEKSLFGEHQGKALLDRAVCAKVIAGTIVVTADFSTPLGGSFYTNSTVTGNWETFMIEELVPYIDKTYRTLTHRESRGVAGDRAGGYGAIRFAQANPGIFGSVYALHPVATGAGYFVMQSRPNWSLLTSAKSLEDLSSDGFSMVFTAIYQANLPNPNAPPLFFDPPAKLENGKLTLDAAVVDRLQESFFLERQIPKYANNLKTLRGFKFDWGRSDPNLDHVYSNQFYSRKLEEYGISHEAEEYRGGWGDRTWGEDGRVYTDMLPFFDKHLVFQSNPN